MTISSSTASVSYTGSNSTATYAYTFKIFDDDEVVVKVKLTSTLAETTLTKTTDYTVSGVGTAAGGNVVLVDADQAWLDSSGNLLSTYTIHLSRLVPLTQETSITSQGSYRPELHERQFDRLVMIDQQQQRKIDQSFKLPDTETGSSANTTLPDADERADKFFVFDSSGNPTVTSITDIDNAAPVTSPYIVVSADGTLTNERILTGTANQITVTDGGPGGNIVLSIPANAAFSGTNATVTNATITNLTSTNTTTANATVSSLTNTRVTIAGTGGILEDDSGLTYDKSTDILTVAGAVKTTPAAAPGVLANGQLWSDSSQICPTFRTGGMTERLVRCIYSQPGNVTVANTAVETTILTTPAFGTVTIPAGYLTVGKVLKFTATGFYAGTGTPNLTFSLTKAGSAVCSAGPYATTGNATNFILTFIVTVTSVGASGACDMTALVAGSQSTGSGIICSGKTDGHTIDTTGSNVFGVTITWGTAAAANTLTATSVFVEVIG